MLVAPKVGPMIRASRYLTRGITMETAEVQWLMMEAMSPVPEFCRQPVKEISRCLGMKHLQME